MKNEKIIAKDIFVDKYDVFKNKYWDKVPKSMREHIDETVNRALRCSDTKFGFAEYICPECGESTKVPFTCKSKFCNRCGRLYTLKWSEKQQENTLRVAHRHSVFTMPNELRNYFYSRRELLKELQDGVYNVINYWYNKNKNNNWWKTVDYIPYSYLKKSWQKILLDIIKKHYDPYETRQLISKMYKKYPKGFCVNAKRRLNDTRQAVKYIGRYLAIAEYRIVKYEREDHSTYST